MIDLEMKLRLFMNRWLQDGFDFWESKDWRFHRCQSDLVIIETIPPLSWTYSFSTVLSNRNQSNIPNTSRCAKLSPLRFSHPFQHLCFITWFSMWLLQDFFEVPRLIFFHSKNLTGSSKFGHHIISMTRWWFQIFSFAFYPDFWWDDPIWRAYYLFFVQTDCFNHQLVINNNLHKKEPGMY